VDLRGFIGRFDLPAGFRAPSLLAFDDIRAHAITREHLRDDVAGINSSIDHECEFRAGESFTYALYDASDTYLGCYVSWWVTPQAYERDLYATAHRALLHWLDTEFPFTAPFWSNVEMPRRRS
jgi:hypothetical protein